MLLTGLIASVERGLNRVLRLDSTALPRLGRLHGKVIVIECRHPQWRLFILPSAQGLMLAPQWAAPADCTLRAPAASLVQLAISQNKTAVLHSPEVDLEGDSGALLELVGVLQDLELDWEYELSRWLGPVASHLLGGHLRSRADWSRQGMLSLNRNLSEYLSEEARTLVGQREAEARFAELDELKLEVERLEARIEHLFQSLKSSDNA